MKASGLATDAIRPRQALRYTRATRPSVQGDLGSTHTWALEQSASPEHRSDPVRCSTCPSIRHMASVSASAYLPKQKIWLSGLSPSGYFVDISQHRPSSIFSSTPAQNPMLAVSLLCLVAVSTFVHRWRGTEPNASLPLACKGSRNTSSIR
ncbi:hypothetical protein EV175_005716 [Coemansia sp. RSA 1933]|nr:hypothetical protein EV175_005716 [Coemansia sp. RSA 1933]